MRLLRALIALAAVALAPAVAVRAQGVTSAGPDSVAVTVYRAPGRSANTALDLRWLGGYALITETRKVMIPAGRATIRFEGVAGGILPESAIVTGLPEGVREKNLDADLLSPRSLYDRSLGRPVTLRRTTGNTVTEEPAIIRSGPDGAAILQTREGFIAANCSSGTKDRIVYPAVPAGLSAKPTLSIEVDAPAAREATLTLSYLAWGFDWQANYVATMRPDGKHADLFAWVTLANSDVTSFADAETMVVAGRLEKSRRTYDGGRDAGFQFTCFPTMVYEPADVGTFADKSVSESLQRVPGVAMAAPPAPIVVTGMRMAQQEELGDLKLYRIPDRTSVAAMSQKQVALLDKQAVAVDVVYRARIHDDDTGPVGITLRAQNRKEKGLGLPLPAGPVAVFEPRGAQRLLVGQGSVADKAVNEEVEIEVAVSSQISIKIEPTPERDGRGGRGQALTVSNANPYPVRFEADFVDADMFRRTRTSARLGRKNGRDLWSVEVPANGTATLRYRLAGLARP